MERISSKSITALIFHLCFLSLLFSILTIANNPSSSSSSSSASIISRFQEYLRINTAQPNPNYYEAADFILSQAKALSLESQTIEFVKNKPLILIKWPAKDPNLPSVLLNSHADVVPVEIDKWAPPPFGAHIDSHGNIYARGSQDTKCVGLQRLETIRKLKDSGFEPVRTMYVSFVPDEEIGGNDGARKLVNSDVFEKMNVGFVLDEGLPLPAEKYCAFHGERSPWWLVIKAQGAPGHGAKLYDGSAMENLLKSIQSIRRFRASQLDMIKAGLKAEGDVVSVNMVFLKAGTQTPAGFVMNLQPSEAEVGLDVRVPPTADPVSLEKLIAEEWASASRNMTFEVLNLNGEIASPLSVLLVQAKFPVLDKFGKPDLTAADSSNPWWVLLQETVCSTGEKLEKPEINTDSTDARYFRQWGLPGIGFSPMKNTPVLIHDHNEYLNQAEYLKGVDVYVSIFKTYASYTDTMQDKASKDEL